MAGGAFWPTWWWLTETTFRTPDCLKHQLVRAAARALLPLEALFFPTESTLEVKNSSEKKSRDPEKSTLALFLACRPAMRTVFLPVACG